MGVKVIGIKRIGLVSPVGRNRGVNWTPQKTASGLIFKTDFESIDDWTNDGTFSKVADDALIAFDYLPNSFLRTIGGDDQYGIRQASTFFEKGILYLFYDGGNPTDGWFTKWASSNNYGKTWTKLSVFGPGSTKGTGGNWTATAMGWLWKDNNTYYLYRFVTPDTTHSPDPYLKLYGYPAYTELWKATSLVGPWTYINEIDNFPASFASLNVFPGSVIKVGSTYYMFVQGMTTVGGGSDYKDGFATASSQEGNWTINITPISSADILGDTRMPENPKVFYHPTLGKYVCLINTISPTPHLNGPDQDTIQISSNITDWSSSSLRRLNNISVMDGGNELGVISPVQTPDGGVLMGKNGFVVTMYDHDGQRYDPSYHEWRTASFKLLEPSRNALRFDGSVLGKIYKAQVNTDGIYEFAVQYNASTNDTTVCFAYRSDHAGNEYIVSVHNGTDKLTFLKNVNGSLTTLQTATATQLPILQMLNRIKIVVSSTSHKVYLNGQLQINVTDSTFVSGTHIGFWGLNIASDIRLLSVRSSDNVTISALPAGTEVVLKADGGIVAATALAQSNGIATFTLNHWPMESLYFNGRNYPINGGVWGGDVFDASKFTLPACTLNSIVSATVEDGAKDNVVITFAHNLDTTIIPDVSALALIGKTISSISISGAIMTVVASVAYANGDSIGNLVYTRPQTNPLRSNPDTTYIDSFTQAVTNNVLPASIIDYDGNIYTPVVIGTQTWLLENLRTNHYNEGTAIPTGLSNANWAAEDGTTGHDGSFAHANNDAANDAVHGLLYNGYAVKNAKGLAPAGYHVPTFAEQQTLNTYLGGKAVSGGKLKEGGTAHWQTPNTGADNSSGFTAVASGQRDVDGTYAMFNQYSLLWSSTIFSAGYLDFVYMMYNSGAVDDTLNTPYKKGFSIRCLKD